MKILYENILRSFDWKSMICYSILRFWNYTIILSKIYDHSTENIQYKRLTYKASKFVNYTILDWNYTIILFNKYEGNLVSKKFKYS